MKLQVTSGELSIVTNLTNIRSVINTCIDAGNSEIHITVTIPPSDRGPKFKIGDRVIDLATSTEGMAGGATLSTVFVVTEVREQYRTDSGLYRYKLKYNAFGEDRVWYGNDETLDFAE